MAPPIMVDLTASSPAGKGEATTAVQPQEQQTLSFTERAALRQALEKEIRSVQPERLQEVVLTAFRKSQQVVEVFQSLLLVSEDDVAAENSESEGEAESSEGEKHSDNEGASGAYKEENEMLPFSEHRNNPNQLDHCESGVERPSSSREKHGTDQAQAERESNGTRMIVERQVAAESPIDAGGSNPSHKRNLSAYSNMPTQADLKKAVGPKKTVARYAKCQNCEEDFDVTMNYAEACEYHEGYLEIDDESSTLDDWDENCHGHIDHTLEKEYPEGFMWTCCEETGTAAGCQSGWHRK